MNTKLIKAIARATIKPCPEVRESLIAIRKHDGFKFSPHGAIPWECEIKKQGYCYHDGRAYFGRVFASEHDARRAWNMRQLRNAVEFMRELRKMKSSDINRQAEYWGVDLPLDCEHEGSVMRGILKGIEHE